MLCLLIHNCKIATVVNHHVNIWYATLNEVMTHKWRTFVLEDGIFQKEQVCQYLDSSS